MKIWNVKTLLTSLSLVFVIAVASDGAAEDDDLHDDDLHGDELHGDELHGDEPHDDDDHDDDDLHDDDDHDDDDLHDDHDDDQHDDDLHDGCSCICAPQYAPAFGEELAGGVETTATGEQSLAWGNRCQASGEQSLALGELAVASGPNAIAIGHDVQATSSYGFSAGGYIDNRGAAGVAIGEYIDIDASSANAVVVGYNSHVGANSPYSGCFGSYGRVGPEDGISSDATGAIAIGINATSKRPGQIQMSSGLPFLADRAMMGMQVDLAGVPGPLRDRSGKAFIVDYYSFGIYRIELLAATRNAAKHVRLVREVEVTRGGGDITILKDEPALDSAGHPIGDAEMDENGWAFAASPEGSELRLTFDPGADTVVVGATLTWQILGGTVSIPATP